MTTTQLSVCYLEVERLTNVLLRISVPFRETSHIVILGVWARTNFRKIRWRSSLLGASSSTPPCPAGKLCPWVSKAVDGRFHNHKKGEGRVWKVEENGWNVESQVAPVWKVCESRSSLKLSASCAPPPHNFLKQVGFERFWNLSLTYTFPLFTYNQNNWRTSKAFKVQN